MSTAKVQAPVKSAHPVRDFFIGLVILLFAVSLATHGLSGHGGGRGGGQSVHYLADDPCPEGTPGSHQAADWPSSEINPPHLRIHPVMFCLKFRQLAQEAPEGTTANDMFECIGKTFANGARTFADRYYSFTWNFGTAAKAVVHVAPDGRVLDALTENGPWSECAAA